MRVGEVKGRKAARPGGNVHYDELRAEAQALRTELTDVKRQFADILSELRAIRALLKKSEELMLGTGRNAENKLTIKFPRLN